MTSLRESLKQLKDALKKTDTDASERREEGRVFSVHTKHSLETLESTRKLIEKDPHNRDLLDWFAFMLYSNEHFSEAIDIYRRLLKQDEGSIEHMYYLGCCLYRTGRTEEAVSHWQEAIKRDPMGLYGRKAKDKVEQVYERDYEAKLLQDE